MPNNFGSGTLDLPLQGDFDGDGKNDLAIYRPSTATWYINETTAGSVSFSFGEPNVDIPVVANFNGTGRSIAGVFRPTTDQWFITGATGPIPGFGGPGDEPVPGNYITATGPAQLAVYRPSNGQFFIDASPIQVIQVGPANGIPVPGAYDNVTRFASSNNPQSEVTEPAAFNPATGVYTIDGPHGLYTVKFNPGDIPAPGDYDGIGETEAAVYRPSTGQFVINVPSGVGLTPGLKAITFGGPTDIPVSSPYIYRSLPVSATSAIKAASVPVVTSVAPDIAATALTLSTKSSTVAAATASTPAATTLTVKAATATLPNQAVAAQKDYLHDIALSSLQVSQKTAKGNTA